MVPKKVRTLTDRESKALYLLNFFEDLIDKRRLYGEFTVNEDVVALIERDDIAKPLSIEHDPKTDLFRIRLMLPELHKYVNYFCKFVGFVVNIDGSVKTKDGLTINRALGATPKGQNPV